MNSTITATPDQVSHIVRILDTCNLHGGAYERLWAAVEAAEIDFRSPGDGSPMGAEYAVSAIEWLERHGYSSTGPRTPAPVGCQHRADRNGNCISCGAEMHDTSAAPAPAPAGPLASDKQVAFILRLLGEREVSADQAQVWTAMAEHAEAPLTKAQARIMIDALLDKPYKAQAPRDTRPLPQVPEGHYAVDSATGNNDTDFYRVDHGKNGRTYVKRITGGRPDHNVTFTETRSALERIEAAGPVKAGARYGHELGQCGKCNRHLTDQLSRDRGYGPDCWEMIHG